MYEEDTTVTPAAVACYFAHSHTVEAFDEFMSGLLKGVYLEIPSGEDGQMIGAVIEQRP